MTDPLTDGGKSILVVRMTVAMVGTAVNAVLDGPEGSQAMRLHLPDRRPDDARQEGQENPGVHDRDKAAVSSGSRWVGKHAPGV